MDYPSSRSLPPLITPDGWVWHAPSDWGKFWVGEDTDGRRWLVKFRGGFNAVRERAFSVIAQSLGISCQSSTYLKVPIDRLPIRVADLDDEHQLAILFLDEHGPREACEDCPLEGLDQEMNERPFDVEVLKASSVGNAIDIARGEMLGMLCEMHEPPGWLVTPDHKIFQIDNELMFSQSAGAELWDSPWVTYDGQINQSGLDEAARLCRQILELPDDVFSEAAQLPDGYRPEMVWSISDEIKRIRPRATDFLSTLA